MSISSPSPLPNRVQEAIALAKTESGTAEQLVLARILEQRIRIKTRELEQARHASRVGGRIQQRSLLHIAGNAAQSNHLVLAGKDFALQHPLATGFALGFGLVAAPRRLLRAITVVLPLILRFSR